MAGIYMLAIGVTQELYQVIVLKLSKKLGKNGLLLVKVRMLKVVKFGDMGCAFFDRKIRVIVKGRRGGTKVGEVAALASSLLFCGGNEGDGRSWQLWLKLEGTGEQKQKQGISGNPEGEEEE